jgi:hypothetical protein
MTRDEIVAALLVVAFALLVTTHVVIVFGLSSVPPRWRAVVALVVPPLAPYWGWRWMRRRSIVWILSAASYAVLRVLAR